MTTSKMNRRQLGNSNEFNFDPPPPISSTTSLGPNIYIPSTILGTGTGSAAHASNNWSQHLTDMADPFVSGDPSQAYRPASEIDTDGVNDIANAAGGDIFGSSVPATDLHRHSTFDQLQDEQLAKLLQAYVERGPSPTQGIDEDWSSMEAALNSVNEPTGNVGTSVACAPGVAGHAMDITNTPKTNDSAALPTWTATDFPKTHVPAVLSTSPATPASASLQLIDKMSHSPMAIPRSSHFADVDLASYVPKKKSRSGKKHSGDHGPTTAEAFSQSSPVRQNTPANQILGSPFKMPCLPASAPAKQAPSDHASMGTLSSPSPVLSRPLSMSNISPYMTALPGHMPLTNNNQMQTMADTRSRAMSSSYKSPPNHPGFTNELLSSGGSSGSSGSFLERDLPSGGQPSAKRARKDTIPAQAILANAAHEAQMRHQAYFQQVAQARGGEQGTLSLANHFNDHVDPDFKWLERDRTDPEPPPSMVARTTGFEFPIPLPTGTMESVKKEEQEEQEQDDVVFVGQKRKARHMSQDDTHANNIQDPYTLAGLGISQPAPQYLGVFIPHNQAQHTSQNGMPVQHQHQSPRKSLAYGQFPGQSQPQVQMHGQAHSQGEFPRAMLHSRGSSSHKQPQEQSQGRRRSQYRSVDEQPQGMRCSPNNARARAPGTPTPSSRHCSTHSKAGQKVASYSPRSSGTPRKHVQTPNGRPHPSPNHKPTPSQSYSHTPKQTPPHATTPAGLRLHLPTPKQPTSTGSCPNTVSETLAEINRRTENELRALGADVVDYDPNMNWDDAGDGSFGTLFGDIGLLTPAEQTFSEMMGLDMSIPGPQDKYVPQDGSGSLATLDSTLLNTGLNTAVSTGNSHTDRFDTYSFNSHNAADALEIATANGIAMADVSFETGAAGPATGDLGFECDWTKGFAEDKNFDPMDFGF